MSEVVSINAYQKDLDLLRSKFPIPKKPEALVGDSWKRYGGVGRKPQKFKDFSPDQIERSESGGLSLFTQLAHVYHFENAQNKRLVKQLFLKCVKAMLRKDYSKGGTTYLVSRTRVKSTTLYMSEVLKEAGLYKPFIKKWLMEEKFLKAKS